MITSMGDQKRDGQKPTIKYTDLTLAMSFVSSSELFDATAYISLKTGKIYRESDGIDEEDDIPDDIHDSKLYVTVPHQNDLDLGKRLEEWYEFENSAEDSALRERAIDKGLTQE